MKKRFRPKLQARFSMPVKENKEYSVSIEIEDGKVYVDGVGLSAAEAMAFGTACIKAGTELLGLDRFTINSDDAQAKSKPRR